VKTRNKKFSLPTVVARPAGEVKSEVTETGNDVGRFVSLQADTLESLEDAYERAQQAAAELVRLAHCEREMYETALRRAQDRYKEGKQLLDKYDRKGA
jgi:hypothetical protein